MNNGENWEAQTSGIPSGSSKSLTINPEGFIFATTPTGVFRSIESTLPVELSSFTAKVQSPGVMLKWNTATETNNKGFEVQRKLKNMDWTNIGFVNGNGTSSKISSYSFADKFDNTYEGRVLYRLKQVDFNGEFKYTRYIYVDVDFMPKTCQLYQNFPNPFNPSTLIKYFITGESNVTLTIYNSVGQKMEELINKVEPGGFHEVSWNASKYSSGTYYYTLQVNGFENSIVYKETKKLQLIK